jgi:hypothetical protein
MDRRTRYALIVLVIWTMFWSTIVWHAVYSLGLDR